jgi:hypothetical protein
MLEEGNTSKPTRIEQIVIDEASPHEVKGINTLFCFGLVRAVQTPVILAPARNF